MGRRFSVEKLPIEQKDFIMHLLLDGLTDEEIRSEVLRQFDVDLKRSSFGRWRKDVGEVLAERYKGKRFLVRSFVEKLKREGLEIQDDKYQQIIQNLEEHLLTSERELINQNPLKLLIARQDDERLRIKREEIELKKDQLAFDREKHKNAIDRIKVGGETIEDFMEYGNDDPEIITLLTRHLQKFKEFLKNKYAAQS